MNEPDDPVIPGHYFADSKPRRESECSEEQLVEAADSEQAENIDGMARHAELTTNLLAFLRAWHAESASWLRCLIADHERLRAGVERAVQQVIRTTSGDECILAPLIDDDPTATATMLMECRRLADELERAVRVEGTTPRSDR